LHARDCDERFLRVSAVGAVDGSHFPDLSPFGTPPPSRPDSPFKFGKKVSLFALQKFLVLFDSNVRSKIPISELLDATVPKSIKTKRKEIGSAPLCVGSDGLISGSVPRVKRDFIVSVLDIDASKELRTAQLHVGPRAYPDISRAGLLVLDDISKVRVFTNGNCISFVFWLHRGIALFHIFSLINVCRVYAETHSDLSPFCAMTINSISRTYRVVSKVSPVERCLHFAPIRDAALPSGNDIRFLSDSF
jgi:hypothetical protein